ncbi:MAG TPA: hypothetical protein VMD08_09760 [Candidatus Baltobacteraceae bacterium]|nr:hypothetical protein [Candidatus Baltobacteraceae bacterium]
MLEVIVCASVALTVTAEVAKSSIGSIYGPDAPLPFGSVKFKGLVG